MTLSKKSKQIVAILATTLIFVTIKARDIAPLKSLEKTIENKIFVPIKKVNPSINYEKFELKLPLRIIIDNLQGLIPSRPLPLPFKIDQIRSWIEIHKLFLLSIDTKTNALIYDGKVELKTNTGLFADSSKLSLTTKELNLNSYPVLGMLKIFGKLNLNAEAQIKNQINSQSDIEFLDLNLKIMDGSYPGGQMIQGIFKTPEISDADFKANIKKETSNDNFSLKAEFTSSLGDGQINGNFEVKHENKLVDGDFIVNIVFSESGHKSLGGFAALAANMDIDTLNRSWEIKYQIKNSQILNPSVSPVASF